MPRMWQTFLRRPGLVPGRARTTCARPERWAIEAAPDRVDQIVRPERPLQRMGGAGWAIHLGKIGRCELAITKEVPIDHHHRQPRRAVVEPFYRLDALTVRQQDVDNRQIEALRSQRDKSRLRAVS